MKLASPASHPAPTCFLPLFHLLPSPPECVLISLHCYSGPFVSLVMLEGDQCGRGHGEKTPPTDTHTPKNIKAELREHQGREKLPAWARRWYCCLLLVYLPLPFLSFVQFPFIHVNKYASTHPWLFTDIFILLTSCRAALRVSAGWRWTVY